ncbi:MAG: hypothetical protein CMO01_27305 [Thalassobius sp.]|nr:hypothetical protein [Thalassovita sp.]
MHQSIRALKIFYYITSLLLLSLLLESCSPKSDKELGLLKTAKGDAYELILVMDTVKWKGKLGDAVKDIFMEDIKGLPQAEPMFTVRHINPVAFNGFLREHKNIVIVTTFDERTAGSQKLKEFFTPESIKKVREDDELFMLRQTDEFAKGQVVLSLFSKDEATLIKHLKESKTRIQDIMVETERKRMEASLFKARKKELEAALKKSSDIELMIPEGYKLAKEEKDFIWLRYPEYDLDKNILIYYKDYQSQNEFNEDSIMAWREKIMSTYTRDPENPDVYVSIQTIAPVNQRKISISGKYAIETRGLWRLKGRYRGGPFLSYVFADEESGRIYYAEGFAYAPGGSKRQHIRELEVILKKFVAQ